MVGIFDSGSGGLTVLRALKERAPALDAVYFGDFKNMPYGNRSREELGAFTARAIRILVAEGAHNIISACNSVSVFVLERLASTLAENDIHIIDMVRPAARALVTDEHHKTAVLFATRATVESRIYEQEFEKHGMRIVPVATHELAAAIEASLPAKRLHALISETARTLGCKPDIVILGCTQYPLVKNIFEDVFRGLGWSPRLYDPAEAVAQEAVKNYGGGGDGRVTFFLSKDSSFFRTCLARMFPGMRHDVRIMQVNDW